jgi:hypothetical protein
MLPVLLAYINRPLLYIILCDSIYNIAFNIYISGRSETFPSASHPQRFSSGEAINQQKISSFPSFPTHLDQGASSSLNAGTSQLGGSVEINVEEPSPSEDFENQTNGSKFLSVSLV